MKDLNPALLKPIAPAGYRLHVPTGTAGQLETALAAIPASRRDSWRIHRVETGDTIASLAKRYGTSAELIRSANREELPEPGAYAAIPVSYTTPRTQAKTPARRTTLTAKRAVAQKKPAAHKPAAVAQRVSAKPAPHRTPGA